MHTTHLNASASAAAITAAFPRGPRIAFAPETGVGAGAAKPPAARKDDAGTAASGAPEGDKIDKLLAVMTSLSDRLDATSTRLDALEKPKPAPEPDLTGEPEPGEKPRASTAADRADAEVSKFKAGQADREELVKAQTRADAAFCLHGKRAPMPVMGETPMAYRVRMAYDHKIFSRAHDGVDLAAVARADAKAFGLIEDKIYADSAAEASRPTMFDGDEMRRVVRYDRDMMRDVIEFHGPNTYAKRLSPPAQRFAGFRVQPKAA